MHVYEGKTTFTLLRLASGGGGERHNLGDYVRRIDDYIREACLEWTDLVRDSAEWVTGPTSKLD